MIGVGIVGAGMVAGTHVRALQDLRDIAKVEGVYSRNGDRLARFCEEWSVPPARDIDDLLANPAVDVLIILTPPNARLDIVKKAAAAGKHILLEKPVERTLAAASALVDIARDAGVVMGVVFQHRFRDVSIKLAELVGSGTFGALGFAQVNVPWWRPQSYYDEPGRGTYERDGGGVLINQAIHTLDLLLTYTGPVAEVTAMTATTRLHRMEAEDFATAGVTFGAGAVGAIVATTASYPGSPESIELHFERASTLLRAGTLTVSWRDGRIETFGEVSATGGGADPMAFTHDWHAAAQRDFIEALRDGRPPAVTGEEALKVHALIDAMSLSSRERRPVSVSEVQERAR
ncbi:Gfo/Idh/MocA family oxidoreductase [Mesorhizobium sp. CAU 1732]|uniref:Gfo/Idh/MocA family protein n=1 Tax=Mesorhizobium sp. CAU 1732 TaxID=3140358 RepID=UPI003260D4FD